MEKPARPNPIIRRMNFHRKNQIPRNQIMPAINSGNRSSIIQSSAMPTPQSTAAALSQRESRRIRYSSSSHKPDTSSSTFSISPVAAVASCQKLNSSPHSATASKTGSAPTCCQLSFHRLPHGRIFKVRASTPSVSAPVAAEKRFRNKGTIASGSNRKGRVSSQSKGCLANGVQSQPATLAVKGRLVSVTPWLKVSAYNQKATSATTHGRRRVRLNMELLKYISSADDRKNALVTRRGCRVIARPVVPVWSAPSPPVWSCAPFWGR